MNQYRVDGSLIIAVDHGFGNMKTANIVFSNGMAVYYTEPIMSRDYLFFEGKYYVLNQGHKPYASEKINDDDFYILTIAAIAKELRLRGITREQVHLAVGLPLKWRDEALKEHQEIAECTKQMRQHDIPLQVKELASKQDQQSIVPVQAEENTQLLVYAEKLPDRFVEYSLLSVEEKVKRYHMTGKEDTYAMVETYFKRIGRPIYFGEIYDEAKELETAYKSSLIVEQSELIAVEMLVDGITPESYSFLPVDSKAKYFEFDMTDNNYNLNLYKEVMRRMNQKMSSSELFEGYQEIYEVKMMIGMDGTHEKKWDRSR